MVVVKLGGSLLASRQLSDCLASIRRRYRHESVLVVPGGGLFADQVRMAQQHWRFDDRTAHVMALLAMQQMAYLISGLTGWQILASTTDCAAHLDHAQSSSRDASMPQPGPIAIWSPSVAELDAAGVPASWEVTSDSLAAWLAGTLCAQELVLVKAADLPELTDATQCRGEWVDAAFWGMVDRLAVKAKIIGATAFCYCGPKS